MGFGAGKESYPCAAPPVLGAPVSPSAILMAVVVMGRVVGWRARWILGRRVWMMDWRSMVDGDVVCY